MKSSISVVRVMFLSETIFVLHMVINYLMMKLQFVIALMYPSLISTQSHPEIKLETTLLNKQKIVFVNVQSGILPVNVASKISNDGLLKSYFTSSPLALNTA